MDQAAIGRYIAKKRKEKNLTQIQLGEKLGVSNKAVSKWENGKCMPDYGVIRHLCDELGITIAEMMDAEDLPRDSLRAYDEEQVLELLERTQTLEERMERISGAMVLKTVRILFLIALLLMALVTADLGINAVAAGIPELQDGISYHSFLQTEFGLLEEMGIRHRDDFFYAFKTSVWITFALFSANVLLALWKKKV